MKRAMRWYDYMLINAYWFGLTTISQTNALVQPLLVQQFVGEEAQGTFFGTLRLWGLMVAILVQSLFGMVSDRSTLRWGRRRPFIFAGTLANAACIIAVGASAGLAGMTGFWVLFGVAILQQVASNIAHGAEQGLIPDLVPEEKRGRFSGVKAVLELLPVVVVAFLMSPMIAAGNLWGTLLLAMGILVLTMVLTMFVREKPLGETPPPINWAPFLRLAGMTAVFTVIILASGAASRLVGSLLTTTGVNSTTLLLIAMGTVGFAAMATAIALGVWACVRISIGDDIKRNPSFTWWVVNRLAFLAAVNNLSTFAVYFVQGRLGYAEEEAAGPAGNLIMAVGLLIMLTAIPSGWLTDKFGRKRLIAISCIAAAVGTGILLITPNLIVIYVGGCLIGAATGLFFTTNWALGTSLAPPEEAGRYLGISNLAGAGAGAVGAYIGGPMADFFTRNVPSVPGLGYVLLFGILGLLFVVSAIALAGVTEPKRGIS